MPEPRLSLESVKRTCPTCGGPLPCSLHNRALREALLHREIEPPPYERLEVLGTYTDAEGNAQVIWTLHSLSDGAVLVGGGGGSLKRLNPDGSWKDLGTYTDAEGHAQGIWTLHPLPDGAVLVGGGGGSLERWGQDPEKLQQYREQVLAQKRGEIPPMPEEPMV